MEVQAQAAMAIMTMTVQGAQEAIQRAHANPVPAGAPASEHAAVILDLSSAAQALVGSS
jgi:hypothetical protein